MGQAESRQEQFWEACGFGHTNKVRQLIEEGIDVNWVSKTHDSCPIHAASQGKPEIVKMLIEAGCDVNVRDERQCTALHHAAMKGYQECARLLLEAGAVVNVQDKNKWTPLHNAAYWAHPGVTELLISQKADVSIKNKDGRVALHEVARSKSDDEIAVGKTSSMLIETGCDVEARAGTDGFSDFTVLMFASYHGHIGVARYLLEARCEVNAQSSNKWTALHWAADRGHTSVVELLLENDADCSLLSDRKETARDRAGDDDIRAIFDRISPPAVVSTEKKRQRTHSELSEAEIPDISEFPSHLKPPATPSKQSEQHTRALSERSRSTDSYTQAINDTTSSLDESEAITSVSPEEDPDRPVDDCNTSMSGLVMATGEVIKPLTTTPSQKVSEVMTETKQVEENKTTESELPAQQNVTENSVKDGDNEEKPVTEAVAEETDVQEDDKVIVDVKPEETSQSPAEAGSGDRDHISGQSQAIDLANTSLDETRTETVAKDTIHDEVQTEDNSHSSLSSLDVEDTDLNVNKVTTGDTDN